nr:hypothetical protein [Tanacetum cinerariifolium]
MNREISAQVGRGRGKCVMKKGSMVINVGSKKKKSVSKKKGRGEGSKAMIDTRELRSLVDIVKESVEACVINEVKNRFPQVIPKALSEFIRPHLESTVLRALNIKQIHLFIRPSTTTENLTICKIKLKLEKMMSTRPNYIHLHERHTELYNAILNLIADDEIEAKNELIQDDVITKRSHDDYDPLEVREGENKSKKQK